MSRKYRLILFSTFLPLVAASPAPDGRAIVEQGSVGGAAPCSSCHGANLGGNAAIHAPAIAGLPAATIVGRLDHYASPQGHNALMKQVATALTPPERVAVAGYISRLPKAENGPAPSGK
jgi:cytochrome c553